MSIVTNGTEPGQAAPFVWPRDLIRIIIHIPVGALIAAAGLFISPILAGVLAYLFIRYEETEGAACYDKPHKDIAGALIGAGAVILAALI